MIPMLVMTGRVDNVFLTPEKEGKDGKYGGDHKVQLLVDQPQENGEIKRGLVDLKTQHPVYFNSMLNRSVSVPIGTYVSKNDGKPTVGYYILKSWIPSPVAAPTAAAPAAAMSGVAEAPTA